MAYRVNFMKGEERVASVPFAQRAYAEAHARNHFRTERTKHGVTSVHVINDVSKSVIYVYPEGKLNADRP